MSTLKEAVMKAHKLIARQEFQRSNGLVIKKGEVFKVPLRSFVKRGVEYYELHFQDEEPSVIPCAVASFNVDVKDAKKTD